MQFLEETGMNLAFLAQRVNHNIKKGSPGAGSMALQNFQAIDDKRLKALAATDAQAAVIAKMYDDAKASESAGWANEILGGGVAYDESKYDSTDPRNSTGYDTWGFDKTKIVGYKQWKKDKEAFDNFKPPKDARKAFLDSVSGAPTKDVNDAIEASDIMSDIEDNIKIIDDALANESDPNAKKSLSDVLAEVEGAYFDASKAYEDASAKLKRWLGGQSVMQDSIADTISSMQARGQKVHQLFKNWQTHIDANKAKALNALTRSLGLTSAEKANADSMIKANYRHVYDAACKGEISIGNICRKQDFFDMLEKDWPAGCCADPGSCYGAITKNCFGHNSSMTRKEGAFAFCRAFGHKNSEFSNWWGGDCCIMVNPKKAAIAVSSDLYNGASKYGSNVNGSCCALMTDAGVCQVGEHLTKDACTRDLKGLSGDKLMKAMGLDKGNEFLPVGGIRRDQCLAVKFFYGIPQLTATQKAAIKKYGITVYDASGNEVKI